MGFGTVLCSFAYPSPPERQAEVGATLVRRLVLPFSPCVDWRARDTELWGRMAPDIDPSIRPRIFMSCPALCSSHHSFVFKVVTTWARRIRRKVAEGVELSGLKDTGLYVSQLFCLDSSKRIRDPATWAEISPTLAWRPPAGPFALLWSTKKSIGRIIARRRVCGSS